MLLRRNFGAPEKWTPLFGASSRQPWTEHRDAIFDDPYRRYAPWPFQKRPEDLPRTVTTPKIRPPKGAWSAKIQDPNFNKKNVKNVKNEDPCRRSATSLISEDAKKPLFSKKNCHFAWEGWSKLKIDYFLQKNITWRVFWKIVRMSHAKSPLLEKRMPTISGVQK